MPNRKLIGKGAEGELFLTEHDKQKCVEKIRVSKAYRHPELDKRLRKRRTVREAKVIRAARAAMINCPTLLVENVEKSTLIIEYIEGELLARVLVKENPISAKSIDLCGQAGIILGKLHQNKITHGDFTTSNLMVDTKNKVRVIDFGLSEQTDGVEQKAVDVMLFERSLSDVDDNSILFKEFLKQYLSVDKKADEIIARTKLILSRGRYRSKGQ